MNQIKVIQFIIPETNIERRSLRHLEPTFRGRVLPLEKGGTDRTKREADRLESLLQSLLIAFLLKIVYPTRSDECLKDIIWFCNNRSRIFITDNLGFVVQAMSKFVLGTFLRPAFVYIFEYH